MRRHVSHRQGYDRKIFRLMKILKVLKEEKVLYVENMCSEFTVSRKTVCRDIELLNTLGEVIEFDRTRKGYVMAAEDGILCEDL